MSVDRSPQAVLDEISAHERGDDLARLVHTVAFAAADERRPALSDGLAELADRAGITAEDAETPLGNVLRALERGGAEAAGSEARALLSGLLARGVALSPPEGADAQGRVAESLVWLATNTSIDGLSALDAALGDDAEGLWRAVGALVRKVDEGSLPLVGRAGAVIAAAALRESHAPAARAEAEALATGARDPIVRSLVAGEASPEPQADAPAATPLEGDLVAPPRGPVALVLLGFTGILAAMHVARVVGALALRYRRPATMRIGPRGVTVLTRTELLGRRLREREIHVPLDAIQRATREVRYPRLAMYAGLFSLAVGSYLGMTMLIDGGRTGSPELVGVGALLVALGIALDYALEHVMASGKGKCRVVVVPRKGAAIAVGKVDPAAADAALRRLTGA